MKRYSKSHHRKLKNTFYGSLKGEKFNDKDIRQVRGKISKIEKERNMIRKIMKSLLKQTKKGMAKK